MKKHLLIASVALFGAASAFADDLPNPGNKDLGPYSDNLSLQWYAAPTGASADANNARSGIGVNGKFYVVINNTGVAVFGEQGQIKSIDNKTSWVSINVDDAGHVYFRNDKGGWPGNSGNFDSKNAQFCVIDSKTDVIIASDVPMTAGPCRFDQLPHVYGDMVSERVSIVVPAASSTASSGYEFIYDKLESTGDAASIDFVSALKAGGFVAPANQIQTYGTAQCFDTDENGDYRIAVLANNYNNPGENPAATTASWFGHGNNIALYEWSDDEYNYAFTGKWFNTPSHSAVGGFCMFNYDGKNYICYPAGTTADGYPSGDGFFVMPEELVDSPVNMTPTQEGSDWSTQIRKAVATKYATDGIKTGNNYRGINVEPVEGKPGFFTIYHYNPGTSMEVWTLDLTGTTGIEDIVANESEAKIFGGIGVVVTESENPAQVYTLAGQLVAEGKGTIAVPAGVYVVKADNKTAKVIVK